MDQRFRVGYRWACAIYSGVTREDLLKNAVFKQGLDGQCARGNSVQGEGTTSVRALRWGCGMYLSNFGEP